MNKPNTYWVCEVQSQTTGEWMPASGERHETEALAESECEHWRAEEQAAIDADAFTQSNSEYRATERYTECGGIVR